MINPTTYHRPRNLDEAIQQLNQPGSIALAGGGMLLAAITLDYEIVVDTQDITQLIAIEGDAASGLRIGGGASLQSVIEYAGTPLALRQSITRLLASNQRSGISVGESLSASQPPLEWLAMLAVMGAEIEHAGYKKGALSTTFERVSLLDFVDAVAQHGYPYAGLVSAVYLPTVDGRTVQGAAFVGRTPADYPIVNAAAQVRLNEDGVVDSVSVAVAGASPQPVMMVTVDSLAGQALAEESILSAAAEVPAQVNPVADYQGGVDYRREMAAVMVKRALLVCAEQLQ